ncbi:nucleotide pyrophosphatase [Paenibacillus selenitireducens]|uniref:Nucleotide pyrophosphatase n=1 Tax=Paenibacillus selenitireducens TaxID=1324314 RepID=A0A1T2XMF4_9BACL|nr:alkaline phosphatase family protein [Paenibacillus selenitireducens]OPA81047.1 nucleotide pyrophosphatase [Paenibacillus selenitireducens]
MIQFNSVQRVFILGLDGAGNFIQHTDTPVIDSFLQQGAFTLNAQAESPTISAECWGSVLHGVLPHKHQLTNDMANTETFAPDSPYPSIFRLAREAWPAAKLASFTEWSPINKGIVEKGLNIHKESLSGQLLVSSICQYIENHPDVKLLFMQLDQPDGAGHSYGYGPNSPEYLQAITACDRQLGEILGTIERLGLLEDSLVILLTDHGGGGADSHSHGSDHPMDKNVFWGCVGPGIDAGTEIAAISIKDTAAIAAYALGLVAPPSWDAEIPEPLLPTSLKKG